MSNSKFSETEFQFGKSIFNYVLDNSMYINKNECNDYTPPFISYMPGGVPNIDAENELKGMNRQSYKTPKPSLAQGTLPSNDVVDKGTLNQSVQKESWSKKECENKIYYVKRI